MELAEAKKLAEERRREKAEDRLARQKVKAQIARDRAEQAASNDVPKPSTQQPPPTAREVKRDYTTCRLQVSCEWEATGFSNVLSLDRFG